MDRRLVVDRGTTHRDVDAFEAVEFSRDGACDGVLLAESAALGVGQLARGDGTAQESGRKLRRLS